MSYIALEEYELMKDSKYRVYVSAVDKALKSFEYTSEWADLISALGKLNKVLLNHLKFPVIPRRIKISKRLAQCMHPALPSGVHLKALETYDIIFKCMGTNRLSHELFIYSAGLFPLLGHAAMNVRPSLLTVYETHFVPLGERLRPGLSGFLSGVLPGLEEGSDYFERTNSLLEKVCDGVGGSHFYGCLWECLASNVAIRLPAISFVLSHFNKKLSMEDQLHIMGTNIDVMVSALCAALQDSSVLVQRSTLDLLLVGFPMHSSHLVRSDQGRLVTAALTTVLRRDMSLNRRLFAWLLGSEVNMTLMSSEHPLVKRSKITDNSQGSSCNPYFDLYSRDMLIQAIKVVLNTCLNESVPDLRPYRLLVSLLDKPDIGPLILDDILYEVFRTLYLACEISSKNECKSSANKAAKFDSAHKTTCYKGSQELLKTANLLFSTLEPFYIWQYAGSLFEGACKNIKNRQNIITTTISKSPAVDQSINFHSANLSKGIKEVEQTKSAKNTLPEQGDILQSAGGIVKAVGAPPPDVLEVCALTEFLLDMVSLETYVEIPTEHLPELFLKVVTILITYCGSLSLMDITSSLGLCQKILSKVQPSSNFSQEHLQPKKSVSDSSKNIGYKIPMQSGSNHGQLVRQLSDGDSTNFQFLETNDLKPKHAVSRSRSASDVFDKRQGSETGLDSDGEGESLKDTTDDTFESAVEAGNSEDLWIEGAHNEAEAFEVSCAGSKQQSVMQECLRQYEDFYVKFICSRVLDTKVDVFVLFTLLLVPRNETDKDRTLKLLDLLRKCIGESNSGEVGFVDTGNAKNHSYPFRENVSRSHSFQRENGFNEFLVENSACSKGDKAKEHVHIHPTNLDGVEKVSGVIKFKTSESDLLEEAVRRSCNLLVELSTFPTYLSPGSSAFSSLSNNSQKDLEQGRDANLPKWLQVLLVCCCMGEANSAIQLTSVATFLDLIALLRSFTLTAPEYFSQCEELIFGSIEESRSILSSREIGPKFENIPATDGIDRGVISVVIVPLLTPYHFHFLEQRTNVFRSVAESLWSCLGNIGSARPWAVRLLYLLHNAVPEGCQDVVEDVILESMVNLGSAEAFDRFTSLWHLGRDVEGVSGGRVPVLGDRNAGRSFDRALLRCLDALALLPASPARLRTEAWLLHSLLRGDASRILEPLLLMLLEPSTARIGILHMKLQGPGQNSSPTGSPESVRTDSKNANFEETVESKIYAVSSVDGNVKYHVSGHSTSQPLFSRPSHLPRRIFAITSLQRGRKQKSGRSETESAVHSHRFIAKDSVEVTSVANGIRGSMSVFVNPFSSALGSNEEVKRDTLKFSESDSVLEQQNVPCLRVGTSCSDLTERTLSPKTITLKSESLSAPSVVEIKSPSPDKSWCEMNIGEDDSDSDTDSSSDDIEEAEAVVADENKATVNGEDDIKKTLSESRICKKDDDSTGMKVVEEILEDVLLTVVEKCEGDEAIEAEEGRTEERQLKEESNGENTEFDSSTEFISSKAIVYPLHSHMLLYVKAYDSHRALYALSTFANLLRADARTVLCAAAAAGISTSQRGSMMQMLLACHRESVFGRGFHCGSNSSVGRSGKEEKGAANGYGEASSTTTVSDSNSSFLKVNGTNVGRSSDIIARENSSTAARAQRGESTIQASQRLSSSAPTLTSIPSADATSSSTSSFRTSRLLEVAMVVCLYYIRSYYPNFLVEYLNKTEKKGHVEQISKTSNFPSDLEFISNRKARLLSAEVLTLIAAELVQLCGGPGSVVGNGTAGHLASGVGRGFASYVGDLMNRCKVQKITLHCILSSVNSMKNCSVATIVRSALAKKIRNSTFAEEIIKLNDEKYVEEVQINRHEISKDHQECHSAHSESFQIQLLRLLLFLIMLEDQVHNQATDDEGLSKEPASLGNPQEEMIVHLKYRSGLSIPQQPMFLAAVMNALKLDHIRHLHQHWTSLITSALPYMGHSLTHVVINVINQLCCNLEKLSQFYKFQSKRSSDQVSKERLHSNQFTVCLNENLPPDYALTQLDSLTLLCHYCLLDSTPSAQQPILSFSSSSSSSSSNGVSSTSPSTSNGQTPTLAVGSAVVGGNGSGSSAVIPGQIFSNLVHVFMPAPLNQDGTKDKIQGTDPRIAARRTVLCNFPRIIASLSTLWEAVTKSLNEIDDHCNEDYPGGGESTSGLVLGRRRLVRQHLLEFLSPISLHHGSHFLAAIAIAWQERRERDIDKVADACKVLCTPTKEQQVLVDLLSSIRAMPVDTLVQTVNNVLRQPPSVVSGGGTSTNIAQGPVLEVSLLEFLYCYLRKSTTARQLVDSWPSLAVLLRDGSAASTSSPPAHFLMLALLNEFVQRASPLPEKKDQRELQDITAKLVEVVGQVAGACLEQTTWLRRNLSVKEEAQQDTLGFSTKTSKDSKDGVASGNGSNGNASVSGGVISTTARHSVTAQLVLAEYLAPLLDVTYGSQEKERVVTLLTGVMYNITPYLKNHSARNASSFLACSKLLASISGYQYTRRAWRKDAFDLLLDPSLFKMPPSALMYWHTIIDNLMTHDTTTFRDLMARVSMAQSGSLSLFSSREQEYEQRAQLLKRLAFVIFCSETDQYQKYMPEIQERLADSLRLPQVVPSVQAQVFLCFRVLLLRMSPSNITSLWPTIISEMVQVFLLIEREFTADSEEFSSHIRLLSMLDSTWVVNSSNGLHAHGHPAWLHLQLAACKLLDLALMLPAHRLPQFQMYRWAFVGGVGVLESGVRNEAEDDSNGSDGDDKVKSHEFVPHVTRIARLMNKKLNKQLPENPVSGGKLLLTMSSIRSIKELHPFFSALSESNFSTAAICSFASFAPLSCNALLHNGLGSRREAGDNSIICAKEGSESASISHIEAVLEADFLEQFLK